METLRKVLAAIIGIIIIVAIILLAKWVGDQIRLRYFTPKTTSNVQIALPEDNAVPADKANKTATYSATPATGPNDWIYAAAVLMFVSGLAAMKFASLEGYTA